MILTFETLPDSLALQCDLCIIGAGAAGISIAREFVGTSLNVVVIESGEFGVDDRYEELNDGEVVGRPFVGLRQGRRRGLGGTTAAWGGQCCELDSDDFAVRPWIPESGWPLGRAELEPFYRRAERIFGVAGEPYDENVWRRFRLKPVPLDPALLRTTFSVFSPHPRLGRFYRKLFANAPNLRVILGATATKIKTTDNGSRATQIEIRSVSGKRAHVSARAFVLCNGTIESARLLLASRDVTPNGLGNARDLVGRYFQDHPTSDTALIAGTDTRWLQEIYGLLYRGSTWYWPKVTLSPALARETASLNASAFVLFEYDSPAVEILRDMVRTTRTGGKFPLSAARLATLARGAPSVAAAGYRRYILGRSPQAKPSKIALTCTIEQVPNRDSRVTLSDALDGLGMPRPRIDWKISGAERHAFRIITKVVAGEFERLRLGSVVPKPWLATDDESAWIVWDNYHQTGTTRMSDDPARGVVDRNCAVYGVAGLYVSGAPTFPTSGYANPVLTIAAMSIRLSDYLKNILRS